MNQYLDFLSIVLILFFVLSCLRNLERGIIVGILIKPVVDTSWDIQIAGLSIIEIFSVIFLVVSILFISKTKAYNLKDKTLVILWLVAHLGIVIQFLIEPLDGIKSLLKALYFPISLFLLPYILIYSQSSNQKMILRFLIFGALFSSLISIFQFVGIIPYEYDHMSKGLQRANGFYHDMVTSRIYVLQGLLTLAYIQFSKRFTLKAWINWILLIVLLVSSYTLFSKALVGILLVGLILLIVLTRQKFSHYIVGGILFFFLVFMNSETIVETTTTLFSSELDYQEGELDDSSRLFSGRGGLWTDYILKFDKASFLEQMIGLGINTGHAHNEFLRVLLLSGFIGVIAYVLFVFRIILLLIRKIFRSQILFVAAFSMSIMLIDSMSVVWGLYPFYLIVIFGFYITAIHESRILNPDFNYVSHVW